jgi:hypothetical protein
MTRSFVFGRTIGAALVHAQAKGDAVPVEAW